MTSRRASRRNQHSSSTDPSVSANSDEITDFKSLRENLVRKLNLDNWFHLTSLQNLHIFNVNTKENGNLSIRNTIHINIELIVNVYGENDGIILTVKLYQWPQLQSLIKQLECNVKRECDDAFEPDAIDETYHSEDVKDDREWEIDRQGEAVAFDFCAGNDVEADLVDSQQPLTKIEEISVVKTEPETSDTVQTHKSFLCAECGKTFTRKARLKDHQSLHVKHLCSICNETYTGKLDRHMRQRHRDDNQSYECHICCRNYDKLRALKRHMKSKHTAKPKNPSNAVNRTKVTCPICEKEFASKDSLKSHKYRTHNRESWKECLICNRKYDNLKRHMESVHSEEGKKRKEICHICGASYAQMTGLTKHMETKHAKDGEFFCHICNNGKNYRSKWYLKRHFAVVHAYVEQKGIEYSNAFECHLCNERLPSSNTLRHHIRMKHNGVEEAETHFQCEICDKKFGCKESLHSHMSQHTEKTYVCPECGQPFSHPSYLRAHLSQHNNGRKEPKDSRKKACSMCHKEYVAIIDLRMHMMKVHGAILPVKTT